MLKLSNISFYYHKNKQILEAIDFVVAKNEIVAILGASGSGKSSLLKIIAGLEKQQSGSIYLNEKEISHVECNKRNIGLVFQDYALFPHLTVEKNIAFALKKQEKNRVFDLLELIQMQGYQKKYPHQLSGGEKQRVAIARSLAAQPSILLLDEPFSNLDEALKGSLREQLADLLKQTKTTTILVTHDKQDAYAIADRIIYLENGKVKAIEENKQKQIKSCSFQ